MARLIIDREGRSYSKPVRLADDPQTLKAVLNETRWDILTLLAARPRYPAEIADELGIHEQTVYYHIRALEEGGFIEVSETRERGGATAKYYTVTDHGFALELPHGEEHLADRPVPEQPEALHRFLTPFISNGEVRSRIVVGAPDPHGPHQVRARDGHLATDLALFLGQYGRFRPATALDVDVKSAGDFSGNIILIGGPLTNMVTADVNPHLPVRFDTEQFPFRELVSDQTGTTYTDDAVGFIARTPNPHDPDHAVLAVAGIRLAGTKAAVMALTEEHGTVLDGYEHEDKWGRVVKGKDMDGDGTIDAIDVLE